MKLQKGITLIELMIVVAIIGIIAAIAIPNMIRARMVANESACIGTCRAFANAQEIYRRTDWNGDGYKEYARAIGQNGGAPESLYYSAAQGKPIELVDVSFANAEGDALAANVRSKQGYVFQVQLSSNYPSPRPYITFGGLMTAYGISGVPEQFDNSGLNKFQMSNDGVVYQANQGDNLHNMIYDIDPNNGWVSCE